MKQENVQNIHFQFEKFNNEKISFWFTKQKQA